ncbi:hypothetical protein [Scytonema tolypothrichoides]|uniref:hypothetical protein n=1 Tax=Scytonema tolypothrichoides TaxID=1233230 RepID=UPI000B2F7E3A
MGWAGIKNGQLLTLAQTEFDVFITVDRNLSPRQESTTIQYHCNCFTGTILPIGRSEAFST